MRLESHVVSTVPSVVHSLDPMEGQVHDRHASPTHLRSHAHASSHVMSSHALSPVQVISHLLPAMHRTSSQAPPPMQLIVQVQSDGHTIVPLHSSPLEQSTSHVLAASSHDVHPSGHCEITQ